MQLKSKVERLVKSSKSKATKTRKKLDLQVAKLKKAVKTARKEARITRNELGTERQNLADARHHLSHAPVGCEFLFFR